MPVSVRSTAAKGGYVTLARFTASSWEMPTLRIFRDGGALSEVAPRPRASPPATWENGICWFGSGELSLEPLGLGVNHRDAATVSVLKSRPRYAFGRDFTLKSRRRMPVRHYKSVGRWGGALQADSRRNVEQSQRDTE